MRLMPANYGNTVSITYIRIAFLCPTDRMHISSLEVCIFPSSKLLKSQEFIKLISTLFPFRHDEQLISLFQLFSF